MSDFLLVMVRKVFWNSKVQKVINLTDLWHIMIGATDLLLYCQKCPSTEWGNQWGIINLTQREEPQLAVNVWEKKHYWHYSYLQDWNLLLKIQHLIYKTQNSKYRVRLDTGMKFSLFNGWALWQPWKDNGSSMVMVWWMSNHANATTLVSDTKNTGVLLLKTWNQWFPPRGWEPQGGHEPIFRCLWRAWDSHLKKLGATVLEDSFWLGKRVPH